jgi:hypothetical protein
MNLRATSRYLLVLSLLASCTACSHFSEVRAWEKGNLAKNHMRMNADALDSKLSEQVYASKEASSGGNGVGAGGCGCN